MSWGNTWCACEIDQDRKGDAILAALIQMGYCNLDGQQDSAIRHCLNGKDVFVSLPMGQWEIAVLLSTTARMGPTHAAHLVAIVINPLIALMKDQVCSQAK